MSCCLTHHLSKRKRQNKTKVHHQKACQELVTYSGHGEWENRNVQYSHTQVHINQYLAVYQINDKNEGGISVRRDHTSEEGRIGKGLSS
jgi:hypothetical protein